MRGFILTPTYRVVRGIPEVHLYGVLDSGEPCLIVDDRTRPYFFVPARDGSRLGSMAPSAHVEPSDLLTLDGRPVVQVTVPTPSDVPPLRRKLEEAGIAGLEADVRFAYRYLIDRGIRGAFTVDGPSEVHGRLGRVFHNPNLAPAVWTPHLRVLSIDVETNATADEIRSIALHTVDFERVILVHHDIFERAEPVPSEKAAVRRFLEYLHVLDPDVITGWNVVDFDLAVLDRAARRHGLVFAIGRTDDALDLRKDLSFSRDSRAVVMGRQVLDGLALVRGAFIKLDDYKLETAAQTFLGRGKLFAGDARFAAIDDAYLHAPQKLVDYNLQDARLVTEILAMTGLIDLAVERSLLTGMQLDRVSAAIASVDSLYLHALRRRGVVAPSVNPLDTSAHIMGGYVMDSVPGLYRNVLVFDFKSLYPSIIRTFNIDPLTLVRDADATAVSAPNGAAFRRDVPGILPELLSTLANEREQAKRAGLAVKANAIKILMNSFYGVLGAGASRLFSPAVANAVTHFGQHLIRLAAEEARRRGHAVLYGDTDSLFVLAGDAEPEVALARGRELCAEIGAAVGAHIEQTHACASHLELEFEKLYTRFFLPEVRGGKVGSKKRYAGLVVAGGNETIEFVGLESVRRDWSAVSKRFQRGLLDRVFHDHPVEDFVRVFVADLRAGRFDNELVYKKALRKELSAYTRTTPPHVKAARKQGGSPGRIVAYVITANGPEAVGALTAPPDYAHYIEHQIEPVADAILRFLGTDFATVMQTKRQLELF